MITRREAVRLMGTASAAALLARAALAKDVPAPRLAPGAPASPERLALIERFKKESEGLDSQFEARSWKSDWVMPYRLYRPQQASGKLPLVLYLHGSGGLGNDNEKQLGLGNIFGTRVWLLPENRKSFPCYVLAPQTARGWVRYEVDPKTGEVLAIRPGLGDGSRLALEIVEAVRREFAIDEKRIYVTGQSMGGAGVWNMLANRPGLFAAAAVCCGSVSVDDGTGSIDTALWNFHGAADTTVPVSVSRERISARRKAGGRPLSTEYAGVGHNVWEWAYTEPQLVRWLFAQRRR